MDDTQHSIIFSNSLLFSLVFAKPLAEMPDCLVLNPPLLNFQKTFHYFIAFSEPKYFPERHQWKPQLLKFSIIIIIIFYNLHNITFGPNVLMFIFLLIFHFCIRSQMFPNLSHSLPLNKYKIQNIDDFFQIIRSFHEKGSSYILFLLL